MNVVTQSDYVSLDLSIVYFILLLVASITFTIMFSIMVFAQRLEFKYALRTTSLYLFWGMACVSLFALVLIPGQEQNRQEEHLAHSALEACGYSDVELRLSHIQPSTQWWSGYKDNKLITGTVDRAEEHLILLGEGTCNS